MEVYGVFEGGGVRGTALVGAFAAAEARDLSFRALAGTSAGSIVASLIAAGYGAGPIKQILDETDLATFLDPIVPIPALRTLLTWKNLGLYKGDVFQAWIKENLSLALTGGKTRNAVVRFKDLPKPLTVVATDVERQDLMVFSRTQTPETDVADAVRASMSIPFFFRPLRMGGQLFVDGGLISNFPAWAFDEQIQKAPLPILGFRLQADDVRPPRIDNLLELGKATVFTMMKVLNQAEVAHIIRQVNVVDLPTLGVQTTDFSITPERKQKLYDAGFNEALAYLKTNALKPPTPDLNES